MNIFARLYYSNCKLSWCFLLACAVFSISFFNGTTSDPLAEHKKQIKTPFPDDAKKVLERAISCIESDDMSALFKLMAGKNLKSFKENYSNGIFADKDFCPAVLTEDPPVRFEKIKTEHVIVKLYSQKRKCTYAVALKKIDGSFKIHSIMPTEPGV